MLRVCEHCLEAIESHEGRQRVLPLDISWDIDDDDKHIDEDGEEFVFCDWCEEPTYTTIYEIG